MTDCPNSVGSRLDEQAAPLHLVQTVQAGALTLPVGTSPFCTHWRVTENKDRASLSPGPHRSQSSFASFLV